jgi:hypothetical protein
LTLPHPWWFRAAFDELAVVELGGGSDEIAAAQPEEDLLWEIASSNTGNSLKTDLWCTSAVTTSPENSSAR